MDFRELDSLFAPVSQRTVEATWSLESPDKVARAILYWVEGGAMTPPLIEPSGKHLIHFNPSGIIDPGNHIHICNGNHRIAVCRAKGETRIPVLVCPSDKNKISEILKTIDWQDGEPHC